MVPQSGLSDNARTAIEGLVGDALTQRIVQHHLVYAGEQVFAAPGHPRPCTPALLIRYAAEELDFSFRGLYTRWILARMVADDPICVAAWKDVENGWTELKCSLQRFDTIKPFIDERFRDINYFKTIAYLLDFLKMVEDTDFKSVRQQDREHEAQLFENQHAEIVKENDTYRILHIKTAEAARHFGRNTKWCITTPGGESFRRYHSDQHVFIIVMKGRADRFAYSVWRTERSCYELRDARNEKVEKSFLRHRCPDALETVSAMIERDFGAPAPKLSATINTTDFFSAIDHVINIVATTSVRRERSIHDIIYASPPVGQSVEPNPLEHVGLLRWDIQMFPPDNKIITS